MQRYLLGTDDYFPLADQRDWNEKAYFRFTRDSLPGLAIALGDSTWAKKVVDQGVYEVLITFMGEGHSEAHEIKDVYADTFLAYAMGAMPIDIALSGFVYLSPDQDHRLDLIAMYDKALRGSQVQKHKLKLDFVLQNTYMRLLIDSIALSYSAEQQDFAQMSLTGQGYRYAVIEGTP